MPRSYSSDGSDDVEREGLILHRLEADSYGRPVISSEPASEMDVEAISSRNSASSAAAAATAVPKTGALPNWAERGFAARAARSLPIRMAMLAALVGLAGGLFYFALGPHLGLRSAPTRTYESELVWKDGAGLAGLFPTDVGYPGPTETGEPAHLVDTDPVQATLTRGSSPIETRLPKLGSFNPFQHMGPLSPYFSADSFGVDNPKYRALPQPKSGSCSVEQVHILHRHGARYPTSGAPPAKFASFLKNASKYLQFSGALSFLSKWKYALGKELLVPLGREQLYDSGVNAAMEYGRLAAWDVQERNKTVFRAGSQQRIVDSAISWLAGFYGPNWHDNVNLEIQIEAPGFNTTMAPDFACPNAGRSESTPGMKQSADWINHYLKDATKRLQKDLQGGELTPALVYAMQQLCSYETVAFGYSSFCQLFSAEEWRGYEYAWDLQFLGSYGSSSPIGRAMGVGWVNEFVARLSGTKWDPATQTSENATLDADGRTFPLGQRVYADFTHDSTITSVIAALELPNFANALPTYTPDPRRPFYLSHIAPFAARLVFEKINCTTALDAPSTSTSPRSLQHAGREDAAGSSTDSQTTNERYVRLLLNDAIVPLSQLSECENREDGLCTLASFLKSQEKRNERAMWSNCTSG